MAQIVPDGTLPQNSIVLPPINNTSVIEGGTQVGGNLFHSFTDFSVPTGWEAFFNNPVTVENILTRITGTNASNIDGLIRANGTANLFLLNPNGIVFGPNAQLDIGGSFFGSTAESLVFTDGSLYSATELDALPLLTINVPIGLQFGSNGTEAIVNVGNLSVARQQDLTLVGGTVVSTGELAAPEGTILIATSPISNTNLTQFLGNISSPETLGLTVTETGVRWGERSIESGDIAVRQLTSGDAILAASGNVTLIESQLETTGNLNVLAQDTVFVRDSVALPFLAVAGGNLWVQGNRGIDILALNHPQTPFQSGGNLFLVSDGIISGDAHFASGNRFSILNLSGNPGNFSILDGVIMTNAYRLGTGGDVEIHARNVNFERARIITGSISPSILAGNISIDAEESISLSGLTPREETADISSAISTASGKNSGNITINTGRLILRDGAVITTTTGLEGDGGSITVNASESVELVGSTRDSIFPTTIATDMFGDGQSGDLTINTRRLILRDGAFISASAFSTNFFEDNSDRPISNGGNLIINAAESIEISGSSPEGFGSGFYNQAFGPGNAGDITIETGNLTLRDGGRTTVSARTVPQSRLFIPGLTGFFGTIPDNDIRTTLSIPEGVDTLNYMIQQIVSTEATGNAGNIEITANSILIDDRNSFPDDPGGIIGITNSSTGGDITLNVRDSLILRRGSRISTTAGTQQAGGDGGNIDISTPLLVAIPRENSDITANAFAGNGGNVEIITQGLFGIDPRDRGTRFSDITASSQLGTDGEVTLNTPEVDPTSGLVELPEDVVDPNSLRDTRCTGENFQRSRFVITGRGGLPPNPREFLNLSGGWNISNEAIELSTSPTRTLVEAQGWIINEKGQVELVAQMPNSGSNLPIKNSPLPVPTCGFRDEKSNE